MIFLIKTPNHNHTNVINTYQIKSYIRLEHQEIYQDS